MKILYVGMRRDYGKPNKGFSFEHYNLYDPLTKMEGGKHEVMYFPFDEILWAKGKEGMNEELLAMTNKEKPDLCFFVLFESEIKKNVIKEISRNYLTFNWFTDDHWRFDTYSKYWAPLFGWVATTDSHAPEKYKKIGYKYAIKTQWACNHFVYGQSVAKEVHEMSFIGQATISRRETVNAIRKANLPLECWGSGWEGGFLDQDRMIAIFSGSRVNLNMTESFRMPWSMKTLGRIFVHKTIDGKYGLEMPNIWAENFRSFFGTRRAQIKGRNFEIPGCGGFLVTGDADDLREYYEDGKEVIIVKNKKDLIEKARYYLAHEDERRIIANAGYERTMRDHTYEKRFIEIFERMGLR